jgi:hypothetical protein
MQQGIKVPTLLKRDRADRIDDMGNRQLLPLPYFPMF